MSDRVQEIIEELILTAPLDDIPSEEDRASAAKQIRQQIGRELLSKADLYGDKEGVYTAVKALDIREVCQMEES